MLIELNPLKWFGWHPVGGVDAWPMESLQPSKPAKAVEKTMKFLSFFEEIGHWLESHFKKLPAAEVQVSSAANYVVPFVEELDTLVEPGLAPILNPILDKIKTGLAALATTIKQSATPAGQTNLQGVLASLVSNAAALESAFQVKDPATQQRITGLVTLISGEFNAIQTQFAPAKP